MFSRENWCLSKLIDSKIMKIQEVANELRELGQPISRQRVGQCVQEGRAAQAALDLEPIAA